MLSVENLTWILNENLLAPAGIDCWYYFPFGTTENLSNLNQHKPWQPKYEHHALFGFDQEPLLTSSLGRCYDVDLPMAHGTKIIKLLANSEHSNLKKQICRERSMSDWYYFYHGIAAHNWFRDARYVQGHHKPKKVFCSYSHLTDKLRSYRMILTARLIEKNLDVLGDVSFHATKQHCEAEINSEYSHLSDHSKSVIQTNLIHNARALPLIVDHSVINGALSAQLGKEDFALWQNACWHVVNETVFYDMKLHLTEKIFKPIVASRPFILVAAPGNLKYLKSYGFQTFDRWIDESYDSIHDHDSRVDAVIKVLEYLCDLSPAQLSNMLLDMQDTLSYNKKHFFGEFQQKILHELIDNFDACVRVWNNGRLDSDRLIAYNYDTKTVKLILAGVIAGI